MGATAIFCTSLTSLSVSVACRLLRSFRPLACIAVGQVDGLPKLAVCRQVDGIPSPRFSATVSTGTRCRGVTRVPGAYNARPGITLA
jgi:hypothetical protein